MYIEYITPQRVADPNYTKYDSKGGAYRPTWLIRTSDWQKVSGTEATDGYHTLSYVWEQSGEKFLKSDGEYDLKDEGHHWIVKIEKNWVGYKPEVLAFHEVTYDELLQQVCKDFDIGYLWYDKICINQTNKAEKLREIKQMHLIYSNARYTVALVPEVYIHDPKDFDRKNWVSMSTETKVKALAQMQYSLWWKRSWTLEEVMMSTRILIVGESTHFWSLADFKQGEPKETDLLANYMLGFKERKMKSASQVLRFAHFRTSTKELDKIFSLLNIFENIIGIDTDYDSNVSDAMKTFYRLLAKKDLSVMCFGANSYPNGRPMYRTTMRSYDLPSWTGVSGVHPVNPIPEITLDQNSRCTIDDDMRLCIKCRSYTIHPTEYINHDVYLNDERGTVASENYRKVITSMDDFDGNESEALDWSHWCMTKATVCFATHYHKPDDLFPFLSPLLPLSLTEKGCDECVILGVVFDCVKSVQVIDNTLAGCHHHYLSPIAKKSTDGSSYRIIGTILLRHFQIDEPRPSPQEVMDKMFSNLGCETREICIK